MTLIKVKGQEFEADVIQKMIDAGISLVEKNDPASTTLSAPALHGPLQGNSSQFGAFSDPGVRPQRFNAMVRPFSFARMLGVRRSDLHNEILEIKTGVEDIAFTNATGFCGDPPAYGALKTCKRTYTWGDVHFKTDLNALALIGQRKNRADVPAQILNEGAEMNPFIPDMLFNPLTNTRSQLAYELYRCGVGFERAVEQAHFQGVAGTQNNSFWGVQTQWRGLLAEVATGYSDSETGLLCPAADSNVLSFDADVTGTDSNSRTIVEALTDMVYAQIDTAERVGMGGTTFVFVMRKEAYRRIVDEFAYNYANYRLNGAQYNEANVDSQMMQTMRLQMWNNRVLIIDGVAYPVVFSEGIPQETLANNTYKSDVFFLPIDWAGIPLLVAEYYPMDNQYTTEFGNFLGGGQVDVINNGMFLVGQRDTGLCIEYLFQARMRLILETPFLAARLDDVWYTYLPNTRDAIPGASNYSNGGVSYRS